MPEEDVQLLRRYIDEKSEEAFAELVRRHLDLVYAVALRQVGGDAHLAQDVAQIVFTSLARKAASLTARPVLGGWLYRTTQFTAIDAVRADSRRRAREIEAHSMHEFSANSDPETDWEKLRPTLDQAIGELRDDDRDAVVLRFFEGKSFADVGARLRLPENTARMRVERALDRLYASLARRGVTSTSAALAVALANQAGVAAPAGLAAVVTGAALAGVSVGGSTLAFFSVMSFKTILIGTLVVAGLTTAAWEWHSRLGSTLEKGKSASMQRAPTAAEREATVRRKLDEIQNRAPHSPASPGGKQAMELAPAAAAESGREYRDLGQATPRAAFETFARASYFGDVKALGNLIHFDGRGAEKAAGILARLPESAKAQFANAEELYGLFLAAETLPPPQAVIAGATQIDLAPDRVLLITQGPSYNVGEHRFQQTEAGWKRILSEQEVEGIAWLVLHDKSDSPDEK